MNFIKVFTVAVFMILSMMPISAQAEVIYNFVPVHDVKMSPDAYNIGATTKTELEQFMAYEHREPCQHYREPPEGFIYEDCGAYLVEAEQVAEKVVIEWKKPAPVVKPPPVAAVVMPRPEIHFAWDSAMLDTDATHLTYRAAQQIKQYNPRLVIIHGHADTSGSPDYNVGLSQRRADTVRRALTMHGVSDAIMQTRAWGETKPEVPTGDGVRLRENRRVEIELQR